MNASILEDFGSRMPVGAPPARPAAAAKDIDRFDDGYNAGWDDAMAQVEAEQTRVGEGLATRLGSLEQGHRAAVAASLLALEPTLREIFDKLLPRTAERAFLPLLLEEIERLLDDGAGKLALHVAPEEEASVVRLLARAKIGPDRVTVRSEPALSISQAQLRWQGQERRIDLERTLEALDEALESFLATLDRGTDLKESDLKEAANG